MRQKKYYREETERALHNFPFPLPKVSLELIYAIAEIKKAAAQSHRIIGELDQNIAEAIVTVCDEILQGRFDDQFVTASVQGGAGTSINMNVNEVIATRAEEILVQKGKHNEVHPLDHVNKAQSTNDVNPSALKICTIRLSRKLVDSLNKLSGSFESKAGEFKQIRKLGRTHLQDAVPTTLGHEFASYLSILKRDIQRIENAITYLYELNLGGTAIGNSINASPVYSNEVYKQLQKITKLKLRPAANLMSQTSSQADFCHLSAAVNILCIDLSKISSDLRLMASGPRGGLGEISLAELQQGSSIMPGKVNPVLPETMNQVYYYVSGKNLTIHHAAESSCLELGIMFPVLADSLISILKLTQAAVSIFTTRCIDTLQANKDRCEEHLENSTAYATLLVPRLGYDTVRSLVKEALTTKKSLRSVILQKQLLSEQELDKLLAFY